MYGNFAVGYHHIMKDTDRDGLIAYYLDIFKKFGSEPSLILDLGCGAGDITLRLAKKGYDLIGIDISTDMLNIAREENSHENILYLNQDMREFELYGTVDVIYSAFDCLNYITDKRDLKKVFSLCHNYLNPDGLFIFDINTEYKFKNILDKNTFVYDTEKAYLVWQSEYLTRNRICTFFLDMFYKNQKGYERFYEEQEQRAYSVEELTEIALSTGFQVLGIYDSMTFKKYSKTSEKIFFVLRGIK